MPESIKDFSARSELFIEELDRRKTPSDDDNGDNDDNEKNNGKGAAKSPQAYYL